jgi:phosphonate transport system substrate-binding protein
VPALLPMRSPFVPHDSRVRWALGCFVSSLLLSACGGSPEASGTHTLYFSAIPDNNKGMLQERFDKIADYLSETLEIEVIYKASIDYDASVEAFKNGEIQLAWFGGVSGVQAREAVEGARAIAQGKIDPEFVSYFIAHKDAGIVPGAEFPSGMEGKSFTFGNSGSTSGRLMPEFYIRQQTAKSPEEFFGSPNRYSGSHDQTALQVQSHAVDCGALNYRVYDEMVAEGTLDPTVCIKVWTTPTYADYNWTAHPLLDERHGAGFIQRLQDALVGIQDPDLLRAMEREEGLIPASNDEYDGIRSTMLNVGMMR